MPRLRDPVEHVCTLYGERKKEFEEQGWELADVYLELGGGGPRSSELHERFSDFFNGQTRRILASSQVEAKLEYWAGVPDRGAALRDRVLEILAGDQGTESNGKKSSHHPDPQARSLILAHNQLDAQLHAHFCSALDRDRPRGRARRASPDAAVCVLGMSRSGTSLTARVLNVLGVDLGSEEDLMAPASDNNPAGFWEHKGIADLNEDILATLGDAPRQRWRWPPPLDEGWERDPRLERHRRDARAMLEDSFAGLPLWGWKDPRTCLTLPFWQQALAQIHHVESGLRYVICVRHPLDVAGSLEARDGLDRDEAVGLWLRYMSEAVVHTRGCPRTFVSYEGYFPDWEGQVGRLAELLGQYRLSDAQRTAIAAHIDEGLWHQREAERSKSESALPSAVTELYALLMAHCGPHPEPAVEADLDAEAGKALRYCSRHEEQPQRNDAQAGTKQAPSIDRRAEPKGQKPAKRTPVIRALKHYSEGESKNERATPLRDDVLVHFVTRRTSVALPAPHEGDCIDKPVSYAAGPLVIAALRNGAVLREGSYVFTAHNELLRESVDRRSFIDDLSASYPDLERELVATKPERTRGTIAILGGQRAANYFHWWIDVLAKGWMIDNSPYRNCRLMTPPLTYEFQDESLQLLGLETETLTKSLQRFRRLIFAHGLAPGSSQAISPQVKEFAQWVRARLSLTTRARTRKLFLSRRLARTRRVVNEDEILATLDSDFESVDLESMSVRQKADLFSEACLIVAPHGAGLTHLLFCSQPTPVIELVPEGSPPATYRQLAGLLGHPYLAVPCPPSTKGSLRKPANRDISAPARQVAKAASRLRATGTFLF